VSESIAGQALVSVPSLRAGGGGQPRRVQAHRPASERRAAAPARVAGRAPRRRGAPQAHGAGAGGARARAVRRCVPALERVPRCAARTPDGGRLRMPPPRRHCVLPGASARPRALPPSLIETPERPPPHVPPLLIEMSHPEDSAETSGWGRGLARRGSLLDLTAGRLLPRRAEPASEAAMFSTTMAHFCSASTRTTRALRAAPHGSTPPAALSGTTASWSSTRRSQRRQHGRSAGLRAGRCRQADSSLTQAEARQRDPSPHSVLAMERHRDLVLSAVVAELARRCLAQLPRCSGGPRSRSPCRGSRNSRAHRRWRRGPSWMGDRRRFGRGAPRGGSPREPPPPWLPRNYFIIPPRTPSRRAWWKGQENGERARERFDGRWSPLR
jgi:hypothetical protein